MAVSGRKHRKTFNEINITPLTDIFLVLLVIMMVIAPLLDQQGLSLLVPQDNGQNDPKSKVIMVEVSKDNTYKVDDNDVSAGQLLYSLTDLAKTKKDGLLIQADNESSHGAVVKVMDSARTAGITSISVVEK